jgi:hypothetical protein
MHAWPPCRHECAVETGNSRTSSPRPDSANPKSRPHLISQQLPVLRGMGDSVGVGTTLIACSACPAAPWDTAHHWHILDRSPVHRFATAAHGNSTHMQHRDRIVFTTALGLQYCALCSTHTSHRAEVTSWSPNLRQGTRR